MLLYGSRNSSRERKKGECGPGRQDLESGGISISNHVEGAKTDLDWDLKSQQQLVEYHHPRQNPGVYLRQPEPAAPTAHHQLALPPSSTPIAHLHGTSSFTSSTTTLMPEKQGILDGPQSLPDKRYGRIVRNLRWTFLSVYRRLNLLVLLPNVVAMVVLGVQHNLLNLSHDAVATAVAANITASVLIRQELVINLLFIIFSNLPKSLPLRIRRLSAKIYHLGGVHSGAGIAAVVWFWPFSTMWWSIYHKDSFQRAIRLQSGPSPSLWMCSWSASSFSPTLTFEERCITSSRWSTALLDGLQSASFGLSLSSSPSVSGIFSYHDQHC